MKPIAIMRAGAVMRSYSFALFAIAAFSLRVSPQLLAQVPPPIHGVTIDDKHDIRKAKVLPKVLDSLSHLSVKPTARIVYTPGNKKGRFVASSYLEATLQIRSVAYVMGQPVDSFYMHCFTPAEHLARFKDYVDTLGSAVDIWEIGNEINGEWLFGSTRKCRPKASVDQTSQADVVTKMVEAYDYVKSRGKVAALTLYYNSPCRRPAANEMFAWVDANIPARMKTGLDYVLISYYEVDCAGHRPDWESLFRRIADIFPNSRLGISEFGWSNSRSSNEVVKDLISRYYALRPNVSNWVGGGFYWEFAIDMVPRDPRPGSMWTVIDTAMAKQN
ncbi:MAG TPA: hypothetical protein VLT90_06540 [Terriglobales bacterium]|nr:hypothetical protein [Terriglobales bacterium]